MITHVFELRPGVANPKLWWPERADQSRWRRIRKDVLERDDYICVSCQHRALKWMQVHHVLAGEDHDPANLSVLCVACHAVMHVGLSLQFGSVAIWETQLSQVEVVRRSRDGVRRGRSLSEVNAGFGLKEGRLKPVSILWANDLPKGIGSEPRAELPKPLCAIFVDFTQWQLESATPFQSRGRAVTR